MKRRTVFLGGFLLACIAVYCYAGIALKKPASITARQIKTEYDCPIISGGSVTSATCDNKDGSITGVQVSASTDKTQYKWRDATGFLVGTSLDLTGVPAGTYTLEVTDNSFCPDGVKSSPIVIDGKNKVTITGTPAVQGTSACASNGYIKGLTVTGATTYVWRNLDTGTSYPTPTPDITNIPQGRYVLTASNQYCSSSSSTYYLQTPYELPVFIGVTVTQPTCAQNNSEIVFSFTKKLGSPTVHWVLMQDNVPINRGVFVPEVASPVLTFDALPAANYHIAVSDEDFSCPTSITPDYPIHEPVVHIYPDSSQYFPDHCNQHNGSILPYITGTTPPKPQPRFVWTNLATGQVVSNIKLLGKVGAGKYQLDVTDALGCTASAQFVLINDSPPIASPLATASILCLPGRATITASLGKPDSAGVFRLYASPTDSIPLATSKTGAFSRLIDETTDFYIALAHADCESERTKVTATVLANIKIPNSFTPNNDGVNDTWIITGLGKFPGAEVKLFDRSGQQVFYSVNNSPVFDGSYKGKTLPVGVYYYVIDVKEQRCFGQISGTLTLLR